MTLYSTCVKFVSIYYYLGIYTLRNYTIPYTASSPFLLLLFWFIYIFVCCLLLIDYFVFVNIYFSILFFPIDTKQEKNVVFCFCLFLSYIIEDIKHRKQIHTYKYTYHYHHLKKNEPFYLNHQLFGFVLFYILPVKQNKQTIKE